MGNTNTALKEWAVITQALDRGDQLLILRKGGIKEQKKQFVLEKEDFLLYPTYEHQRQDLLKDSRHLGRARLKGEPRPDSLGPNGPSTDSRFLGHRSAAGQFIPIAGHFLQHNMPVNILG